MGRILRPGIPALASGLAVALLVAGMSASAADQTVTAEGSADWNPSQLTITAGDKVTWQNPISGGDHDVCVSRGTTQGVCDEYKSGDPQLPAQWPSGGYSHVFSAAGTYVFECTLHTNMTGTITVTSSGTATTTYDTTPTYTQTGSADTTAPAFTGKLRRRVSRTALVLELGSSEDATLSATVFRRPPHAHSFTRLGKSSAAVHAGHNVVRLRRFKPRSGAYRVRLVLTDAADNASRPHTLVFKVG